jgi:hypothetical protein
MSRSLSLRHLLIVFSLFGAIPAFASRPYAVEERTVAKLRAGGQKLIVDQIPMFDGNPATLVLERFEVWAQDAQIIKYDSERKETRLPRPLTKFYRGRIVGDPGSLVFMSVEPNGVVNGMALSGDGKRKLSIRQGVRAGREGGPRREDAEPPLMVREFDEVDDVTALANGGDFHCDVEGRDMKIAQSLKNLTVKPEGNTAPSVTTGYGLNLAIETDGELYAAFGSDPAVTAYLGNLIGAASTVYQRDLKTTLTIGTTHLWSNAATDPWTVLPASGTGAALAEFGLYWHNNYAGVNRSSVVFVSGKAFFGGVAWFDQLCTNDFFCGVTGASCSSATYANSYAGGYAFCGSTVVTTTVPDPNATVNGIQYGLPNTNDFWMLLEVCHELGHNANGDHTHCVPLSVAQQALYGVPGRTYVDLCYGSEFGCYAGATSAPAEKGTIMSYCHNITVGGFRASRYLFGKAGEPSELMFASFTAAFDAATPNGAISLGAAEPLPCSAGQTASVAAASSYAWQITGGAFTSVTNTASVTFTPSAPSVVLTCTVGNVKGCTITSQRTATALCGSLPAPTGVDAHATSTSNVQISWNSVATATSYEVSRLDTLGSAYSVLGTTSSLLFNDPVSVNKAYLYKVRAVAPSTGSYSTPDLATVVIYANPTLTVGVSTVARQDLIDIRNAAQAVRTLANQGVFSFTDSTITAGTTVISAVHQSELRTVVNSAFTALSLPAIVYAHPTPTIGSVIYASDMTDLRNGVR